jgi:putative acetyltransferase
MNQILDIWQSRRYISGMRTPDVEIRGFEKGDEAAFRELNEAWIAKYFVLEDADRAALGDPSGYILGRGGHVYMACAGGRAVGTCALIVTGPDAFEVAKMAVDEAYQGMGIGRKLLQHAVAEAKQLGAKTLSLETNTKLQSALHLYETTGFRHLPAERVAPSAYARANVFMEMEL